MKQLVRRHAETLDEPARGESGTTRLRSGTSSSTSVALRRQGFEGFMQHRARGSCAKPLQRRGVPLNVIQQIGGWERAGDGPGGTSATTASRS